MTAFSRFLTGFALLLLPIGAHAQDRRAPGVPERLPSYQLLDQFNRLVADSSLARRASIIIVAGRSGAEAAERWTTRLRELLAPSGPTVVPVADLAGAPRMLRGFIRSMFPRDSSAGVALDWEGVIGRPIRGDRAPLIAAVYGADGRLREWMSLSTRTEDPLVLRRLVALAN
jgi:hypothetical protein